jgi:hypothetical protein
VKEEFDLDSIGMINEQMLTNMGVPNGPRLKFIKAAAERASASRTPDPPRPAPPEPALSLSARDGEQCASAELLSYYRTQR